MTAFTTTALSRSLLNDTDTSLVAQCSTNWNQVRNGNGIATVTCDQYDAQSCADHQDLEFDADQVACLEPSAMPSSMPSGMPSESPSISTAPSESPSGMPSVSPSISTEPTYYPTWAPEGRTKKTKNSND